MLRLIIPVKTVFLGPATTSISGGILTIGAIVGEVNGAISPQTGITIGFVGGIVSTASLLAWFFRGYLDKLAAQVDRVDMKHANEINILKTEITRLKKKTGVE